MELHDIPQTAIRVWLRTARLPLSALELLTRRGEHDTEWPPALAFESFEAQVKQISGSLLRDDDLVEDGRLTEAKVAQLRKAAELETIAERREATADARLAARHDANERRRKKVEQAAAQREEALDRRRAAEQRKLENAERQRRDAADRAAVAQQHVVEREEREAERTRIKAERDALRKQRVAAAAEKRAVDADKKLATTKARRQAGR
jgi:hypothetical protein